MGSYLLTIKQVGHLSSEEAANPAFSSDPQTDDHNRRCL